MTTNGGGLLVRGVTKSFGALVANDHLDLDIAPGEVFGLLGPNGAGKSTLVRQIIGLLRPDRGAIQLAGRDLVEEPNAARQLCAYLPQGELPIASFRLREAVELVGRIRGARRAWVRERAEELIQRLEIGEWERSFGHSLSGGVKRLVGFVMACVCPVPLVILDEPTNDVDPLRRRLLWREVRKLREEGMAVLLVTHNVLEAEHSVDRLAVIDQGRILAQGTPSSLKAAERHRLRLVLHLKPGEPPPEPAGWTDQRLLLGRRFHLLLNETDAAAALEWARRCMEEGRAEEYALGAATLEDVYLRLVGREDALDLGDAAAGGAA